MAAGSDTGGGDVVVSALLDEAIAKKGKGLIILQEHNLPGQPSNRLGYDFIISHIDLLAAKGIKSIFLEDLP